MNVTPQTTIRRLVTGDEAVRATLATRRVPSDDEARAFLGDDDVVLLGAFDHEGIGRGFVLTNRDNAAAMCLSRSAGVRLASDEVLWEFDYRAR